MATLKTILARLWDTSKNTSQTSIVQLLYQLLEKNLPENNTLTNKYRHITSCSLTYKLLKGKYLDNKAELFFKKQQYDEAARLDKNLLFSGYLRPQLLFRRARDAFQHFHFLQALYFCLLLRAIFPRWQPGKTLLLQGKCLQLCSRPAEALASYAQAMLVYGLPAVIDTPGYDGALQKQLHDLRWRTTFALAQATDPRIPPLKRAQAFLLGGAYEEAENLLNELPKWYHLRTRYHFLRARTCIALGKKQEAETLLIKLIQRKTNYVPAYNETLRLACLSGDISLLSQIHERAQKNSITLTPSLEWVALCRLGKPKEAFLHLGRADYFHILAPYTGNKFLQTLPRRRDKVGTLLVLSECFPGDEVRFSRLYPLIQKHAQAEQVIFSCDPRMLKVLQRTFPDMSFLATRRAQSVAMLGDYSDFTALPDIECCRYVDNKGWAAIQKADAIISVVHALGDIMQDYAQLTKIPYLCPNPQKKAYFQSHLMRFRPQKLVGLCWRSMQHSFSRDWGNFRLEDFSPLFQMEGIQLVNCQYDGLTSQEHSWIEKFFPGKLLSFEEADLKDDLDIAMALFSNLDIMVTAPTYTCEVSGAVGTPTLIIAASHMPDAFAAPGTNYHAFHGSHVRFICTFGKGKAIIIDDIKKNLENMLKRNKSI